MSTVLEKEIEIKEISLRERLRLDYTLEDEFRDNDGMVLLELMSFDPVVSEMLGGLPDKDRKAWGGGFVKGLQTIFRGFGM